MNDLIELRAGGVAIASQAALDFIYGSSATQLARLAAGAALTVPRINAAGNGWEFAAASAIAGAVKLYAANVAVLTTISVPSNLDTFAISGLLATDKLLIVVDTETGEGNATYLYHSTGSVALTGATTGGAEQIVCVLGRAPNTANLFRSTRSVNGTLTQTAPNAGNPYTGSWTIAIRDDNGIIGGTKHVSWAIWKLVG